MEKFTGMKEFNYLTYRKQDEFNKYQGIGCIFNIIQGFMKFAKKFQLWHDAQDDDCDIVSLTIFWTFLLSL